MTRPEPSTAAEREDRVYLDKMARTRVYIAAGFAVIGFLIIWPMLPGASWVNHHAFSPAVHWWRTQPGRMAFQYGSGVIVAVLVTWSGVRHGWKVAALRGLILMAGFWLLALVIF